MQRYTSLPLFPLLLLAACAGSPYAESKRYDRLRSYDAADHGVVVASVGKRTNAARFSSTEVVFRLRGTEELGAFTYAPKAYLTSDGASPKDFATPEVEGTVVVKRLPPGTYDVYLAKGVSNIGGTFIYSRPLTPPLSFTVSSGDTTYAARFVIGQDGWTPSSPMTLTISSELDADVAVATRRFQSIKRPPSSVATVPTKS